MTTTIYDFFLFIGRAFLINLFAFGVFVIGVAALDENTFINFVKTNRKTGLFLIACAVFSALAIGSAIGLAWE